MSDGITPPWACSQWGQYEHDWLDCPDCLAAYERYLEEPEVAEVPDAGPRPKFAVGQPVFIVIHNDPAVRRGMVFQSHGPRDGEFVYAVFRGDGRTAPYRESDLADAGGVFVEPGFPGGGEGKYGTLAALAAKLHPDEPWFALRSQDRFAPGVVEEYSERLRRAGLLAAAADVRAFVRRMCRWQDDHPEQVKTPD